MTTIHKYPLEIMDVNEIKVPRLGTFLHTGLDPSGIPCVWAKVDTKEPLMMRRVYLCGTGQPLEFFKQTYLGTINQGPFVWHIFTDS